MVARSRIIVKHKISHIAVQKMCNATKIAHAELFG